jgi:exodeoxyribonuclease-1
MNTPTILWHDYETFGVNPRVDFPVQFAAIRTTVDLEIIEKQININWLCKMPLDYLPHPQACLITGITPSYSLAKGLSEPAFANKIYQQMIEPNTCVAGYNSMRFDEEVTRHLLFRNFFPVYEREYKNDNSRWDVIDLVRACYALRPENINWPKYDNGKPCFTLSALCKTNEIEHESAHDALSDVHATISIAKLVKTKQPKLYEYFWQLRNKHKINEMLQQFQKNLFVYVSGFVSSAQGCCTVIMPVCPHPKNNNAILCIDLLHSIELFKQNNVHSLTQALFNKNMGTENTEDQIRANNQPRIYTIACNKCPFVAPIKTLAPAQASSFGIDLNLATKHYQQLLNMPHLSSLCASLFDSLSDKEVSNNIDEQLYTSDFPSAADTQVMGNVRHAVPEQLAIFSGKFDNELFNQLLFRYRARNYPNLLDETEMHKWQRHIQDRLTRSNKPQCLSLDEFALSLDELSFEYQQYPDKMKVLQSLRQYAKQLVAI